MKKQERKLQLPENVQKNASTIVFVHFVKDGMIYRRFGARFWAGYVLEEISILGDYLSRESTKANSFKSLTLCSKYWTNGDNELYQEVKNYLISLDYFYETLIEAVIKDNGLIFTIPADNESLTRYEMVEILPLLDQFIILNRPFGYTESFKQDVSKNFRELAQGTRVIDEMSNIDIIQYLRYSRGQNILQNMDRDYFKSTLDHNFTDEEWFEFLHFVDEQWEEDNPLMAEDFSDKWEEEKQKRGYTYHYEKPILVSSGTSGLGITSKPTPKPRKRPRSTQNESKSNSCIIMHISKQINQIETCPE
jgi:hypothetical protein